MGMPGERGAAGRDRWLVVLAVVLALAGVAGFYALFLRRLTVYWLILAPVILALYEVPAVFVFWLFKRRRGAGGDGRGE
jgi:hypothetical protein